MTNEPNEPDPDAHARGFRSGYDAAIHDARVRGSRAHFELYGDADEPDRRLDPDEIPDDFAVRPIDPDAAPAGADVMTCGTCGLSWDDSVPTSWTPVPSGRCPFEYFHAHAD